MGLFNKKQMKNTVEKKNVKKVGLNELSGDSLLNVAGGQTYHNEDDKLANEEYIKDLTKKPI